MKRLYIILCTLFLALSAFAGDVKMTVSAPTTLEVGDKFRVQFTVNTQSVSNFSAPDFKGFDVIYGPSTSTQSSFQIINGHTSQSSSITYTFVLMAANAGTFTVNPASIQAEGKTVRSNSVKIKVLPAGQGGGSSSQQQQAQAYGYSSRQQQQQQVQRPSQSTSTGSNISAKDLFMTATASRTNVYEQEAILVTYKIYTLVNLTQLDGKLPTLDGFQIQEVPLPRNKEFQLEQYNGRNYRTVVWSQYVLFPQKSGKLTIPPITYEGVVVQQNRAIDPIEAFFNGTGGVVEVKKKITTPALNINVSALPTKPEGFSGAVGQFTLSSSISGTEVNANDAITLKVNVKGAGNMKLINTPSVEWPKDFETYDAKVADNFKLTTSGLQGSKSFEYLAVPRHPGKFTVPAVKFVYFDTQSHSYKTLVTEPYTINVKKGKGGNTQSANYSNNQQDVAELAQDIRYIKLSEGRIVNPEDSFFGSWKYISAYLIPLALFAIIAALLQKFAKENANVARSRGKKANKKATKRLKVASGLLAKKQQNEFYDEVMRALWGYIADKLNMPQEALNKDNIQSELSAKNVPQELIDQFIRTLNECEFARYAPGADANATMENVYQAAIDTISKIEDTL